MKVDALQILGGALFVLLTLSSVRLLLALAGTDPSHWLDEYVPLVRGPSAGAEVGDRAERVAALVSDPMLFPALYGSCSRWPRVNANADDCLRILDETLATQPTASELWLERARVLFAMERPDGAARSLERSFETGRREGWIASSRLVVGLRNWNDLPSDLRSLVQSDLRIVLAREGLSDRLAAEFIRDPDLRERVTALLDEMGMPEGAREFIDLVRSRLPGRPGQGQFSGSS
jgi:hypothetical protein